MFPRESLPAAGDGFSQMSKFKTNLWSEERVESGSRGELMSRRNIKSMLFEDGAGEWLGWVRQRVKPTSYAQYIVKYEKNIRSYLGKTKWAELTGEQIKGLEKRLLEEGLTPQYAYDNLVQTKMITKYVSRVYGCPDPGLDVVLEKPGRRQAADGQGWTVQSVQGWNAQDQAVPDGGLREQAASQDIQGQAAASQDIQGQAVDGQDIQGQAAASQGIQEQAMDGSGTQGLYGDRRDVQSQKPGRERGRGEILYDETLCERLCQSLTKDPTPTKAGILLTLFGGLKIGELCALRWEDVDLDEGLVSVRQTLQRISVGENTGLVLIDLKGGPGERVIPLAPFLREILEGMRREESCFFLSGKETPVEPRTMQYRLRALLKSEGLPDISFSSLRKLFISRCMSSGVDLVTITEILGNATVQSTYASCSRPSLRSKIEAIGLVAEGVR